MSNTPTTQFNQELCDLVRSGKLAIENTDKEKLQQLLKYIFPLCTATFTGVSEYYHSKGGSNSEWYGSIVTSRPHRPVSDFFLPAVSPCGTCKGHGKIINPDDPTNDLPCPECTNVPAVSDNEEDYYRIDFVNCDKDYDYTICRDWSEVMDYVSLSEGDIIKPDASLKITTVKLTEKEYDKFFKTLKP